MKRNTMKNIKRFLSIIVMCLIISCENNKSIQQSYQYCNKDGIYGEMHFNKDGFLAIYSYFSLDTFFAPEGIYYKYKAISNNRIILRNPETNDSMFCFNYTKADDINLLLLFEKDTLLLKKIEDSPPNEMFQKSGKDLDLWVHRRYKPRYTNRMNKFVCP